MTHELIDQANRLWAKAGPPIGSVFNAFIERSEKYGTRLLLMVDVPGVGRKGMTHLRCSGYLDLEAARQLPNVIEELYAKMRRELNRVNEIGVRF